MEAYKQHLISNLCVYGCKTLEEIERRCTGLDYVTINRNENGRMHSRYLGDRYEPAIQRKLGDFCVNYYLFDGEIRDCTYPFSIRYCKNQIEEVVYYSSERIKNGEPTYMAHSYTYYNQYRHSATETKIILDEYNSKLTNNGLLSSFSELCEELEELERIPIFKFAD